MGDFVGFPFSIALARSGISTSKLTLHRRCSVYFLFLVSSSLSPTLPHSSLTVASTLSSSGTHISERGLPVLP